MYITLTPCDSGSPHKDPKRHLLPDYPDNLYHGCSLHRSHRPLLFPGKSLSIQLHQSFNGRSLTAHDPDAQWVFAVVLLGLTGARLHYTENLAPTDPLNGGHHFYDPIIAELLAASLLSMLWSTFASVP
jgi:hypothetical protein